MNKMNAGFGWEGLCPLGKVLTNKNLIYLLCKYILPYGQSASTTTAWKVGRLLGTLD